jgi:hypothetical protein
MEQKCPFHVGDKVRFIPDDHTVGWTQHFWGTPKIRLHPGDIGVVTRIENDRDVFLDDDRGGFHWNLYELVEPVSGPDRDV